MATRRIRFNGSDGPVLPRSSSSSGYSKGKSGNSSVIRSVILFGLLLGTVYVVTRAIKSSKMKAAGTGEGEGLEDVADHWGSHDHQFHDGHPHDLHDQHHYSDHDHYDNPHGHHQYTTGRDPHMQNHKHIQHEPAVHNPADDGSMIVNTAGKQAAAAGQQHAELPPAHSVGGGAPSHEAPAHTGQHDTAAQHPPATQEPVVPQQPHQQQQQQQQHHVQREADILPEWSADGTPEAQQHHEDHAVLKDPYVTPQGLYTLSAKDIDGNERKLSGYAGQVTLVVNVASHCGFTDSNYKGLQEAYNKYRSHGLEIFAFPCNQFGDQEPGTNAEIKSWAQQTYNVTFPLFSKVDVNGPNAHPVFEFLRRELPIDQGGGGGTGPGRDFVWNFQKVLVNRHGQPVKLINQDWHQGIVEHAIYDLLVSEQ